MGLFLTQLPQANWKKSVQGSAVRSRALRSMLATGLGRTSLDVVAAGRVPGFVCPGCCLMVGVLTGCCDAAGLVGDCANAPAVHRSAATTMVRVIIGVPSLVGFSYGKSSNR